MQIERGSSVDCCFHRDCGDEEMVIAELAPIAVRWPGRGGDYIIFAARAALLGRGRDESYLSPPAQIRASATNAHGSYLGCLAQNRSSG